MFSERTCDYPGRPEGGETEGTWPAKAGEIAFFSCCEGLEIIGSYYAVCTSVGWSHQVPICGGKHKT